MTIPLVTLALDTPMKPDLLSWLLRPGNVNILKLGVWSLLTHNYGHTPEQSVEEMGRKVAKKQNVPLFYDLKLADTLDTNVATIGRLPEGAYVTITTPLYSPADLEEMVRRCAQQGVTPIAVPITSSTKSPPLSPNMTRNGFFLSELDRVVGCGFGDVVCDGSLLPYMKNLRTRAHVPGVRPKWYGKQNNHKYTITPAEAKAAGAYNLIIGRPITDQRSDEDVLSALGHIRTEINTFA